MLLQLRDYLQARESANLQEMAWHFNQSPETVRCWLGHWLQKGRVCRVENPLGCGTKCQVCQPQLAEVYRWVS